MCWVKITKCRFSPLSYSLGLPPAMKYVQSLICLFSKFYYSIFKIEFPDFMKISGDNLRMQKEEITPLKGLGTGGGGGLLRHSSILLPTIVLSIKRKGLAFSGWLCVTTAPALLQGFSLLDCLETSKALF